MNNFLLDFTDDVEIFEAINHAKSIGALCRITPRSKDAIAQIERKLKIQKISGNSSMHGMEEKVNELSYLKYLTLKFNLVKCSTNSNSLFFGRNGECTFIYSICY